MLSILNNACIWHVRTRKLVQTCFSNIFFLLKTGVKKKLKGSKNDVALSLSGVNIFNCPGGASWISQTCFNCRTSNTVCTKPKKNLGSLTEETCRLAVDNTENMTVYYDPTASTCFSLQCTEDVAYKMETQVNPWVARATCNMGM